MNCFCVSLFVETLTTNSLLSIMLAVVQAYRSYRVFQMIYDFLVVLAPITTPDVYVVTLWGVLHNNLREMNILGRE